ncbi:MAG TPA: hypothetical protein VMJ64_09995 [Anaerolineales bacterium]|nr:hypothetical protein [Anaerolineales bacterium]
MRPDHDHIEELKLAGAVSALLNGQGVSRRALNAASLLSLTRGHRSV